MAERPGEAAGQPNDEFGPNPLIDPSVFEVPETGGKKPQAEPEFPITDLPTQYLPGFHPTFPLPRPVPPQAQPQAGGPEWATPQPQAEVPEWARPQPLPPLGQQPPDPAPTTWINPADPAPTARFNPAAFGVPPPGSIERQIPGVTQPRPPTVAEARARDKARKQAAIDAETAAQAAARKRRIMRGGVAVAGVAAIVGVGYLVHEAVKPDKDTVAQCTEERDGQPVVVSDSYCSGSPGLGGFFYFGGHQYRYYYGGPAGGDGSIARGGSYTAPADGSIHTRGGSVIRGGFGSGGGGFGGEEGGGSHGGS